MHAYVFCIILQIVQVAVELVERAVEINVREVDLIVPHHASASKSFELCKPVIVHAKRLKLSETIVIKRSKRFELCESIIVRFHFRRRRR